MLLTIYIVVEDVRDAFTLVSPEHRSNTKRVLTDTISYNESKFKEKIEIRMCDVIRKYKDNKSM